MSELLALAAFCLVASITPGPNNMMLMSSGLTFGFRRTIPHIVGISTGCCSMALAAGATLGGVMRHLPAFHVVLQVVSAAYLLWLAWRIARSSGLEEAGVRGRPLTVVEAAVFQLVNPKAWAMVLGAVTSFADPGSMALDAGLIAIALVVVGIPSITLWAASGSALRRFFRNPGALRGFNCAMALLLVASILPGLWDIARQAMRGA